MPHDFDALTSYLHSLHAGNIQHTRTDLQSHLLGVYRLLQQWQRSEVEMLAGLFHSVYGTEGFPRATLALDNRDGLRDHIGVDAERLVYAYCAMSYASLERCVKAVEHIRLWDRFAGEPLLLSEQEFEQVLWIKLADGLDQAPDETRHSLFFTCLATNLGEAGLEVFRAE